MYIQKMTEKGENDNYIKCSRCTCKYINDDKHIKKDFGYNRLHERFKTCITCREKSDKYSQSDKGKEYRDKYKQTSVTCENCGQTTTKGVIAAHKRRYQCQVHTACPKPSYKEWLLSQNYDTLLWEYKTDYKQFKGEP